MRDQVTSVLSHIELRTDVPPPMPAPPHYVEQYEREPAMADADWAPAPPLAAPRDNPAAQPRGGGQPAGPRAPWAGTPRNATCPCGSGKKFKHCHGRV
jgi:preprotein translocase subunit SecA